MRLLAVIAVLIALLATNATAQTHIKWEATWANPVNRNLYRLAVCETGGINNGKPLWTHYNSTYAGALGFTHGTWNQYAPRTYPRPASRASPSQQYAVGRVLVKLFGYSPWPACHRRLGIY